MKYIKTYENSRKIVKEVFDFYTNINIVFRKYYTQDAGYKLEILYKGDKELKNIRSIELRGEFFDTYTLFLIRMKDNSIEITYYQNWLVPDEFNDFIMDKFKNEITPMIDLKSKISSLSKKTFSVDELREINSNFQKDYEFIMNTKKYNL